MQLEHDHRPLTDPSRLPEILAVMHRAFAPLVIDPPSGALRETVADLASTSGARHDLHRAGGRGDRRQRVLRPQENALYVGRLAVSPSHQRRGIARALMAQAEAEARRLALPKLTLRARIMLTDNIAFFRACGFVAVAEHAHAGYAHPTSVEMEKRL